MVLYPDNKDAMKAFDFKEFFVTGPDGIAYPERVYTYSLHTADGNIPVILDRSYYEPSFPAKNRVSVNKVNQIIDNNGTPNFKEWVEFYQS